jgi:hypothetical protein
MAYFFLHAQAAANAIQAQRWQPQQRKKQERPRPSTTASTTYMTRNVTASTTAEAEPLFRLREESPGSRFHRSERDSDDASLDGARTPGEAAVPRSLLFQRPVLGRWDSRGTSRRSHRPRDRAPAAGLASGDMGAVSEISRAAATATTASSMAIDDCFAVALRKV